MDGDKLPNFTLLLQTLEKNAAQQLREEKIKAE